MTLVKDRSAATRAFLLGATGVLLWPSFQCGGYSNPPVAGGPDAGAGSGAATGIGSGGAGPGTGGAAVTGSGGDSSTGSGGNGGPGSGGNGTTGSGGSVGPGTGGGVVIGSGGTAGARAGSGGATGSGGGTNGGTGGAGAVKTDPAIDGPFGAAYEYKVHHPFRLTFDGPASSDTATPNPFLDFCLVVTFKTPSGKTYAVPGYFAGDGNFGGTGARWRVHFNPPEVGAYTYTVDFRAGAGVAILTGAPTGTAMAPDGKTGSFSVGTTDKVAPDFRGTGKLAYVKGHYLHTIGDGKPWIKTGSNSPENFLGYNEFSNTTDGPLGLAKGFLHSYAKHVADWKTGDPTWNGGKGKGIIGVINYYASVGVNEAGFLSQNLNGDGDDTIPWASRTDRTHFDNKKLQEWEVMFSHMETKGVAWQNFLSEQENFTLLGLNTNGRVEYHEMVARFAHHGGIMWNIGEENAYSVADRKGIAAYLMAIDPYHNPVGNHSLSMASPTEYPPLYGDPNIVEASMQDSLTRVASLATTFRTDTAKAGVPWVIMMDEQTPAGTGISDCPSPGMGNCDAVRKSTVWPFLLAGGGGFEWYMGYGNVCTDVNCEDLRSRAAMFNYSRIAREFLQRLPLDEMVQGDALVTQNGNVFYKKGAAYAIYLPSGGNATLNLAGESGSWQVRFYNVTTGSYGPPSMVTGGGAVSLGAPPFSGDVAAVVEKM